MTGDSKAKKLWEKLFVPPCPLCKSSDAVEMTHTGRAIICASELVKQMMRNAKGLPPSDPDAKCYRCNKCHTVYDNRGGRIQVK